MHRESSFHVYPRYTAGSPAMVSRELCERVLAEERQAIEWRLIGYQGEAAKLDAQARGIAGIAFERWEKRNTYYERDLATDGVAQFPIRHGHVVRPQPTTRSTQ